MNWHTLELAIFLLHAVMQNTCLFKMSEITHTHTIKYLLYCYGIHHVTVVIVRYYRATA